MVLRLSPLHVNSPEDGNHIQNGRSERFILPRMEENLVEGGTVHTHEFCTYFQSQSANSPVVDLCTLVWPNLKGPPTLLAFQVSSEVEGHGAKAIGSDRVNKLGPVDARRYLIIFTLKAVEPQVTMLITWLLMEFPGCCGVHDGHCIFHCKINLVKLFCREKPKCKVMPLV